MAVINQSPAGQSSLALGGIRWDSLVKGSELVRRVRRSVSTASVELRWTGSTSSGGGGQVASTGQIHPSGR